MKEYATVQKELARQVVRLRLDGDVFQPFRSWKRIAKEMGLKNSELGEIRKSQAFADEAAEVALGKAQVFHDIGRKVSSKIVRDWLKAAFGMDFARSHGKAVWKKVKAAEPLTQ